MRRYQQHTHASWHRAYADKFDCPWCQPPQNQNHDCKQSAKSSDNGRTSRANATSTPVGHRRALQSSDVPIEDQAAHTLLESQTPDSVLDANHEETLEPESDSNHGQYNMEPSARQEGLNPADTLRPPLPEEWTTDTEDREHDAAKESPPAVEDWRSGLNTTEEAQIPSGETIGSPELNVRDSEEY
ncbi:hypothetical protein PDIDSM_570 [Penicillium digitatum]|nr:hypothetical protein PDIDSM_570 [Penicillium digitatum]